MSPKPVILNQELLNPENILTPLLEPIFGGELGCALIYGDEPTSQHYQTLSVLEYALHHKGYKTFRVPDQANKNIEYFTKLENIAATASLAIVILDGLKPSVLFELGFFKGAEKPVIVLQSSQAVVNVKTLFRAPDLSGLGAENYQKLKSPKINLAMHFPDFDPKRIANFEFSVKETDPDHPLNRLSEELHRNSEQIIKTTVNQLMLHLAFPNDPKISEILERLSQSFQCQVSLTPEELQDLYQQLQTTIEPKGVPYQIRNFVAITAVFAGINTVSQSTTNSIAYFNQAINIYHESGAHLPVKEHGELWPDLQYKIGFTYTWLATLVEKSENCKNAMKAYREALKHLDPSQHRPTYGLIQYNMAITYSLLAETEDKNVNYKLTIGAYREALKKLSHRTTPAGICSNQ